MVRRIRWGLLAPLFILGACAPLPLTPIGPLDEASEPVATYRVQASSPLSIVGITVDSEDPALPKARLADGDPATAWRNGTYKAPTSWAAAQLSGTFPLSAIGVKTGPSAAGTSYDLQVSEDGATWTTVASGLTNSTWNIELKSLPAGTSARHVRLYWRNNPTTPQANFALYELQVHGGASSPSPMPTATPSPAPSSGTGGTFPQYYPNLTAAASKNFYITSSGSTKFLRFPGTIANTGPGHMQVRGEVEGDVTHATQEVLDPAGRVVQTQDVGTFAYHPSHGHFHVTNVARYELRQGSPDGKLVKVAPKVSFCLADSIRYQSSSETSRYPKCMPTLQGITRSFADVYNAGLPGQEFDVTGLPAGEYYFVIVIDPLNKFLDANRGNNLAWSRISMNPATGRVWAMSTSN